MAEHDVFESRLRAALLRHVADGPTDFDALGFARMVAAKEPRRRGLAAALTWRGVAIPRVAWVLLLLAGLLAALVGGMLVVGSQLERRLPAVVPPVGPAFACPPGSTPDEPGPIDQARPLDVSALAFDRRAGRLVALAGAETWTFDVCTNTWTQMHPNRVPSSFEWPQLVYDVDSDTTIFASYRDVWAYDLQTDTWTEKRVAPTDAYFIVYDPVSGLVVAGNWDPTALWEYDVETDTWTPIRQANGPELYGPFAYDASVDRMVMPSGRETWLLDMRTGRWSAAGAEAPDVIEVLAVAPTITYDESAELTVVIGDVRMAAYDATVDRWEILAEADPDRAEGWGLRAVYDPVNGRLVGWRRSFNRDQDELFAFDLATREWTVLLAASERQPAPAGATPRP